MAVADLWDGDAPGEALTPIAPDEQTDCPACAQGDAVTSQRIAELRTRAVAERRHTREGIWYPTRREIVARMRRRHELARIAGGSDLQREAPFW